MMLTSDGVYILRSVRKIQIAERDTVKEQEIMPGVLPSERLCEQKSCDSGQDIPSRDVKTNDTNTERGKLRCLQRRL